MAFAVLGGMSISTLTTGEPPTRSSILVVEDDPSTRQALYELLDEEGYAVTTANDGMAGIAAVESDVPDLIVSDVSMPRIDGFQMVEQLRARPRSAQIPILLMSAISQPMRRVIGLDLGADDFVAKPVDFDELLARIRALLRRAREREQLEYRATIDAVTGVLNRTGLDAALSREHQRSLRTDTPLSILMIDLDRFKALNDEHGHQVGDHALRGVAETLSAAVRATDSVGRYGGDEFLVILPGTTEVAAALLAARLKSISLPGISIGDGGQLVVQISIGAATRAPDDTVAALLERADRAMYRIKRTSQPPATKRA